MTSRYATLMALVALAGLPACAPDERAQGDLAGDWQLVSIVSPTYSAEVGPTPTPPIVRFRASSAVEGSVGWTDGCNDWDAGYTIPASGEVRIGPLSSTLRQCIRVYTLAEGGYSGAELPAVTRFSRTGNQLVLSSDDNTTRLTFRQ